VVSGQGTGRWRSYAAGDEAVEDGIGVSEIIERTNLMVLGLG
jgi:hypothetical protein